MLNTSAGVVTHKEQLKYSKDDEEEEDEEEEEDKPEVWYVRLLGGIY